MDGSSCSAPGIWTAAAEGPCRWSMHSSGEAAMLARCVLCTERRGTDWVMPHDKAGVSPLGDGDACFRLPQSNSNAMDDNCACELNLLHLNLLYT